MSDCSGVYGLIDPRTYEIRYVGQSRHLKQRVAEHRVSTTAYPVDLWIRKLKSLGLRPLVLVLETCGEALLDVTEVKWIVVLRDRGELLNCGEGGRGTRGYLQPPFSEEHKERISQGIRRKWQDPTYAAKIRNSRKGSTFTPEHRANLSRALRQRWSNLRAS